MTDLDAAAREQLRSLLEAGTPGPWHIVGGRISGLPLGSHLVLRTERGTYLWVEPETRMGSDEADAALIVFLRNHADELLAAAEREPLLEAVAEAAHRIPRPLRPVSGNTPILSNRDAEVLWNALAALDVGHAAKEEA